MQDDDVDVTRPVGDELLRRFVEVQNCARRVARGDRGLARRGDMGPDDLAQDIAEQYLRRTDEPISLMGWAATATRCRLIDLARRKNPIAIDSDALFRAMGHAMGPSAGVVSRDQYRRVIDILGPVQQSVINEHLAGATNEEIARSHGYASAAVAATRISQIKKDLKLGFPSLKFDLAPQRLYG